MHAHRYSTKRLSQYRMQYLDSRKATIGAAWQEELSLSAYISVCSIVHSIMVWYHDATVLMYASFWSAASVVVLPPHPHGLWTASSSHEEEEEIEGSVAGISEDIRQFYISCPWNVNNYLWINNSGCLHEGDDSEVSRIAKHTLGEHHPINLEETSIMGASTTMEDCMEILGCRITLHLWCGFMLCQFIIWSIKSSVRIQNLHDIWQLFPVDK